MPKPRYRINGDVSVFKEGYRRGILFALANVDDLLDEFENMYGCMSDLDYFLADLRQRFHFVRKSTLDSIDKEPVIYGHETGGENHG